MMRPLVALIIALLLAVPAGYTEEPLALVIAADSPVRQLALADVKLIYLCKSQIDNDGQRWLPLNLPANDELRRGFALALFGELPEAQEDYWNVQYFNGINPPKVMASEEAVLRFVSSTTGALGYVRLHKADRRVKVLQLLTPPTHP